MKRKKIERCKHFFSFFLPGVIKRVRVNAYRKVRDIFLNVSALT